MKISLVHGDDWEGLFINGILVTEGHRVTIEEVVIAVSERLVRQDIQFENLEANYKWLEDRGGFTEKLEKVKIGNDGSNR